MPGPRVRPARGSPERMNVGVKPTHVPYVVPASASEAMAIAEPISIEVAVPGGNPVTAVPGLRLKSPVRTVKPELVTVDEALTAESLELAPRLRARAWGVDKRVRARMRGKVITVGDMVGDE